MSERIGKYLTAELVETLRGKTKQWDIHGSDDSVLGVIRWYSAWRQYTFWPNGQLGLLAATVLNATCLEDIAKFAKAETERHMAALDREGAVK